jgi:hypothetical protein
MERNRYTMRANRRGTTQRPDRLRSGRCFRDSLVAANRQPLLRFADFVMCPGKSCADAIIQGCSLTAAVVIYAHHSPLPPGHVRSQRPART